MALAFLSHLVEENSGRAAGDVEGVCVARLHHQVTDLPVHLSPRRAAAAIGKLVVCIFYGAYTKKESIKITQTSVSEEYRNCTQRQTYIVGFIWCYREFESNGDSSNK